MRFPTVFRQPLKYSQHELYTYLFNMLDVTSLSCDGHAALAPLIKYNWAVHNNTTNNNDYIYIYIYISCVVIIIIVLS